MYSAWAGQTALDSLPPPMTDPDLVNSIYTRKLLPLMRKRNLQLRDLAAQVRDEVHALAATAHHPQTPAYYDGVIGKFCLGGCDPDSETGAAKQDELAEMRKRLAALEAAMKQGQDKPKDERIAAAKPVKIFAPGTRQSGLRSRSPCIGSCSGGEAGYTRQSGLRSCTPCTGGRRFLCVVEKQSR